MRKLAAVVSAGMSRIGKREELAGQELALEAFLEASENCKNITSKQIGALYVGSQSETYEHQIMYGSLVAGWLGLLPSASVRVEACAASGAMALHLGVMDILSGLHDVVLVCGLEKMSSRTTHQVTDALMSASDILERYNGMTFPSIYAIMATSHMARYGSNEEDLASIAVKNHKNALENPKAHLQKLITKEDVLNSKTVAWPLKLYDCSPISDGAAVAILTKPELARRYSDSPTYITGMGIKSDTVGLYEREDIAWPNAIAGACKEAYNMAGITSSSISLAEVHDCFTINEILSYEAAGFAARGRGHLLARNCETEISGRIPVNTSGGLKARGHPVGATGLCQVYEVHLQLSGRAGRRQVPKPKIGLTINEGGSNAAVGVHVFAN